MMETRFIYLMWTRSRSERTINKDEAQLPSGDKSAGIPSDVIFCRKACQHFLEAPTLAEITKVFKVPDRDISSEYP